MNSLDHKTLLSVTSIVKLLGKAPAGNCAVLVKFAGRRTTNSNKPREKAVTDDRLVTSGSLIANVDERSYETFTVTGVNGAACKESSRLYSGRSVVGGTVNISGKTMKFNGWQQKSEAVIVAMRALKDA